jgi:hypothetical protein
MSFRTLVTAAALWIFLASGARAADEVKLLTLGDWGVNSPARSEVGRAMAIFATQPGNTPDGVLLLGDNFYVKLSGVDDPQIQTFFEKTYDAEKLNVPFYAVMGNHDYRNDDVRIEMDYARSGHTRLKIPARWYRLEFPSDKPLVTVLMLDSDAPPDLMKQKDWEEETAWLNSELAKPHAPWLVCCAHHDMFGNGNHGDNGVLMTTWGNLFKQAHVDFYVCGHEHTLQHLEIPNWPMSFVIAGGGGAGTKPMLRDNRGPFSRATYGFGSFHFTPELATVQLVGADGKVVHEFTRTRVGNVTVTINSPSDAATKHKLKTINGID